MDRERSSNFRPDINGLRALSVLLVVLFHFRIPGFEGGFIGVDVFFVISGFLMTKIIVTGLEKRDFSYVRFVAARAARIVPALYVLLALLLLLGCALLPPIDLYGVATQAAAAALFYSNRFFHDTQAYFVSGLDDRWLLHTWSLSVEWQFYLLYPLLLACFAWLCRSLSFEKVDLRARCLGILVPAAIASLIFCATTTSISPKSAFFLLLPRAWEMLAGGIVFLLGTPARLGSRTRALLGYGGLVIVVVACALIGKLELEASWPGIYALAPVLGACISIWASQANNVVLNHPIAQRIGDASYSIYLYHWPIVVAVHVTYFVHEHITFARLFGIALSFALGFASYRWVESQRLMVAARPWRAVGSALAACALVYVAAMGVIRSDGLAVRTGAMQTEHRRLIRADLTDDAMSACENNRKLRADWKLCVLNPKAKGPRVLVIGDSHAAHLHPWFAHNSQVRTEFFVKRGCPLSPGFNRPEPGNFCADFVDLAFKLARSGQYSVVVLSSKWRTNGIDAHRLCAVGYAGCTPPRAIPADRAPVATLEKALLGVLAGPTRVVVVEDTPAAEFNVPRHLSRELFWLGHATADIDAKPFLARNQEFGSLFARLGEHPNFRSISLHGELCAHGRCRISDPSTGEPVFRDRDHFNPHWLIAHGEPLRSLSMPPAPLTAAAMPVRSGP